MMMKSILDHYELWYEPLKEICRKAESKLRPADIFMKICEARKEK